MHCIGQTKIMASDPKMEDNVNKINYKMHNAEHCFFMVQKQRQQRMLVEKNYRLVT